MPLNRIAADMADVLVEVRKVRDHIEHTPDETLRDRIARAALTGLLTRAAFEPDPVARAAYVYADAMIAAREQTPKP